MIRKAKPSDVPDIFADALHVLSGLKTNLVVSKPRIINAATRMVSDASQLVLVDEEGGTVAVAVYDALAFERKVAGLVFFNGKSVWQILRLLRAAVAWSDRRPGIKAIGWSNDFGVDERVCVLLRRAGLVKRGSVFARG